ncbi:MAG: hypothetical protein VX951_13155 [Planctomycetota bacterium]|nr:hypothetical protein [Planctomycetota bacterium]
MKFVLSVFALTTGLTCQVAEPQATRLAVLQEPLQFEIRVMESAPPQFAVIAKLRFPTAGYRIKVDSFSKPDPQGRMLAKVTAIAPRGLAAAVIEEKEARFLIGYCNVGEYLLEVHWRDTEKGAYRYRTSLLLAATNKHGTFTIKKDARAWELKVRERPVTSRFVATKTGQKLALGFRTPSTGWKLRVNEVGKPNPQGRVRVTVTGQAPRTARPKRSVEQVQVDLGPLKPGRYVVEVFYRASRDHKHALLDLVPVEAKQP